MKKKWPHNNELGYYITLENHNMNNQIKKIAFAALCALVFAQNPVYSAADVKKLVFEEQRLEGKIRRPQLVLIKADERPSFAPMAIISIGVSDDITAYVDQKVLTRSPYDRPFIIEGTRVVNIVP